MQSTGVKRLAVTFVAAGFRGIGTQQLENLPMKIRISGLGSFIAFLEFLVVKSAHPVKEP